MYGSHRARAEPGEMYRRDYVVLFTQDGCIQRGNKVLACEEIEKEED